MPGAGDACVTFTTTPNGVLPYAFNGTDATDCSCYQQCREAYICDVRLCMASMLRKDCAQMSPVVDTFGAASPCAG